jgi:hypothetical protein
MKSVKKLLSQVNAPQAACFYPFYHLANEIHVSNFAELSSVSRFNMDKKSVNHMTKTERSMNANTINTNVQARITNNYYQNWDREYPGKKNWLNE